MSGQAVSAPGRWQRVLGFVGLAAHLLVGVVPYGVSQLVAPPTGIVLLWVLWLVLLVLAVVAVRRRPILTPLVPVAALVLWFAVVSAGDAWLGWRA